MMFTSKYSDDLGIVFIVGDDAGPPQIDLPDGSLEIDTRPQIRVPPSNTETWDEAACIESFHALAEATRDLSIDIYWEFAAFLPSIKVTSEEFNAWREKRGYHEANFWKPRDLLVGPQERKTWQAKPVCVLSETENAVLKAINEIWPDGISDHKAKARDERIRDRLRGTQQSTVSARTIQRTLTKIHFA
jgi:hypothetical protein